MICSKCGTENKEIAKFCKNCGNRLEAEAAAEVKPQETQETVLEKAAAEKESPVAGNAESTDAPQSDASGDAPESAVRRCPSCGAEVSEAAMFCRSCGQKLEPAGAKPTAGSSTGSPAENNNDKTENPGQAPVGSGAANAAAGSASANAAAGGTSAGSAPSGGAVAPYGNANAGNYYRPIREDQLPPKYRPLGAWAYFGWSLLFSIPIAGLIVALVFALGSTENINLRNFARSMFCYMAVVAALVLLTFCGMGCTAGIML